MSGVLTIRALTDMVKRQRYEQLAREQLQAFFDAAAFPKSMVWADASHVAIEDADGGTARLLELLAQGVTGIDGVTRAKCGEIEIAARKGTR
jgi:hypothetical protein